MEGVTRLVAIVSVSLGVGFFFLAGAIGMDFEERFLFAIGVIVANVPEGLLPTVTLSLALATQRMARRNAIVRKLSSIETLGSTSVICTDKTGTLTANQMTVRSVWLAGGERFAVGGAGYAPDGELHPAATAPLIELARAAALCNDATLTPPGDADAEWTIVGDPTEGALLTLAMKAGLDLAAEAHEHVRIDELPFDSERKRMTTLHAAPGGGRVAYVKGAADGVLERSALSEPTRAAAHAAAHEMASQALRVLAIARRADPPAGAPDTIEGDLEFLGLVGMEDPPREEVADAIAACRDAGIRVIMVTGDHGVTAAAIASEVGMVEGPARVLDGAQLDDFDDDQLGHELARPDVLVARVTPQGKQRIARVLRAGGAVVAMTGDGVNDAPALREADIGIAMGRHGTDVAREAADIVLTDDNFRSIAAAVEEGRAVFDNIRRFAQYHFSSNVAELSAFLAWGVSGGAIPLPLVVMQVLAIDLVTDLLPALALGTEPPEPGVMKRAPRPRSQRLLTLRVLGRVYGFVGLLVAVAGLASFFAIYLAAGWRPGDALTASGELYEQATAMTLAGIVAGQIGAAFAFRTNRDSVISVGLLSNRLLLAGVATEIIALIAFVTVPPLQEIFHTAALPLWAWLLLLAWPPLVLGAEELRKLAFRRFVWRA